MTELTRTLSTAARTIRETEDFGIACDTYLAARTEYREAYPNGFDAPTGVDDAWRAVIAAFRREDF